MKKLLLILLKMGIVGTILIYLIRSGRLNFEKLMLFQEAPEILGLMVGVLIFAVVPMATFRWWLLLKAIGVPLEPKQAFVLTWIGNFFNTTLPGAVTGDVVKGYYVIKAQEEEGRTRAFMTLLIDRFVGLFGLIVMAFFALLFNLELILAQEQLHSLAWMITALFGGTVLFYLIALYPFKQGHDPFLRLFQRLPASKFSIKVYSAFKIFQHQKITLISTLLLAIGIHTLIALIFFQVTQLMGIKEMELATQFFLMPIGLITVAIPIAPGGIGIGHAAFESLYQLAGFSGGADIFNLFIIVQLGVFLLGGIPYFLYSSKYKIPKNQQEMLD
ncbi:MAG: flippase-like domain-containing protein [SAR324 cluster bacterium]|nr:flippase-like domain-containing protein [SAR324 cluster bacterium]MBL7035540.1 flippase-like domain-containing protein [SAR324 cluster bacterium]